MAVRLLRKLRRAAAASRRRLARRADFATAGDWLRWNYDAMLRVFPSVSRRTRPLLVRPRGLDGAVGLRPRTTDGVVFDEVFVRQTYAMAAQLAGRREGVVVDLGANVGLSLRYFASRCPGGRLIGVEPDRENLQAARLNTASLGDRATLVHAGVASQDGSAALCRTDFAAGFFVEVPGRGDFDRKLAVRSREPIEMISMPTLLDRFAPGERVRLLKCDIEGGEFDLFADCADWIGRVDVLALEVHGQGGVERLLSMLEANHANLQVVEHVPSLQHALLTLARE